MSMPEAAPPLVELMQSDDVAKYLLRDRTEILYVLRALMNRHPLVTAYVGRRHDHFLLTAVLALQEKEGMLVLDYGADEPTNQRALSADRLTCITQLDKIKIQFACGPAKRIDYEGKPALLVPVPDSLLRLQRREYYRLTAPAAHGLTCIIPVVENGVERRISATVIDISGGGLAVMVPPVGVRFEPDMEFSRCRVDLPEVGIVESRLRVRNLFRITTGPGAPMERAGCEFIGLPSATMSLIQRYILKVERERKARERGF